MMTDKQLLVRYETERVALAAKMAIDTTRMDALVGLIGSLRVMTGEAPPKPVRRRGGATGTKALILDVLAGGQARSLREVADGCRVKPSALKYHLTPLVESGDVQRSGRGRSTLYRIA